MSITPSHPHLGELLAQLEWSQADLARASRLSPATVHRALTGAQTSALTRARIVAASHARRGELQQHLVHRPACWERPQLSGQRGLRWQQYHSTRWGYFP